MFRNSLAISLAYIRKAALGGGFSLAYRRQRSSLFLLGFDFSSAAPRDTARDMKRENHFGRGY
jgi:hypothetical protein